MAWTQTDFDAVDAAIRAVRDGARRQSVSSETGALAFMNTPLLDLIKLRDAIGWSSARRRAAARSGRGFT